MERIKSMFRHAFNIVTHPLTNGKCCTCKYQHRHCSAEPCISCGRIGGHYYMWISKKVK